MRQEVITDLVKNLLKFTKVGKIRCVIDSPDDVYADTGTWFVDIFIDNRIFVIEYYGDDKPFGLSEVGDNIDSGYGQTAPDHLCSTSEALVNKLIELISQ